MSATAPSPAPGAKPAGRDGQVIGIDLGGTAIKLGRFSRDGQLQARREHPTPRPSTPGAVCMLLAEAIAELDPERLADRVGIGLPGPSDAAGRIARIAINLDGWEDVPLADWLEPRIERPVILANDANCAALGELWGGAAQGSRDVLLLTLGTGVGGAVLLNGQLFTGRSGAAAEPGLITVNPEGPACHSGNRGSLEQYCSIRGLARLSPLPPPILCQKAREGDPEALAAWSAYGRWLGIGLSSLVYVLTPELVLLGGGLSAGFTYFLPALQHELNARVLGVSREGMVIRRCALGNDAGQLGAVRLALDRLG